MSLEFFHFDWRVGLADQRALFSACFPENAGLPSVTEAYYHRKFHALPHTPASYEFAVQDAEGYAGYYAALPFRYRIGGERYLCGMVCDVMTSPRMQGKGVFTKLGAYSIGELGRDGLDFVTGYPRRAAVIPGHLKVGWKIAFQLPMYLMPLRSRGVLATKGFGWLSGAVDMGLRLFQGCLSLAARVPQGISWDVVDWRTFLESEEAPAFLESWIASRPVALEKSPAFLAWRLSIQEVDYRIARVRSSGRLVAVSILRACNPEGVPAMAVLDLMCIDENRAVMNAMRRAWITCAEAWNREVVLMMAGEAQARDHQFQRLGLLRTPTVFSFIIQCLSDRAKAGVPMEPEAWHLMWIDSDDL